MSALNPEVVTLVKEAIRLEIKGRNFFVHAAEITKHKLGKKMYDKLAKDEVEHMKVFGELFTAVTGGEEWKKFVKAEEKESSAIIDDLKARIESSVKKGGGELEAIRIGMELERKAINFFTKFASESFTREAKEIAETICDQERSHYDLLQAQYDSVEKSGFWFDVAEFKLDGQY